MEISFLNWPLRRALTGLLVSISNATSAWALRPLAKPQSFTFHAGEDGVANRPDRQMVLGRKFD